MPNSGLWAAREGRWPATAVGPRPLSRLQNVRHVYFATLLLGAEFVIIVLASLLASFLRFDQLVLPQPLPVIAAVMPFMVVFGMRVLGVYEQIGTNTLRLGFTSTALAFVLCFMGVLAAAYILKIGDEISRLWLGYFALGGFAGVLAFRIIVLLVLNYLGLAKYFDTSLYIIHDGSDPEIVDELKVRASIQRTSVSGEMVLPNESGATRELSEIALSMLQSRPPDLVILILAEGAGEAAKETLARLQALSVPLLFFQKNVTETIQRRRFPEWQWTTFAGLPFMSECGTRFSKRAHLAKLFEDYLLATILVALLSPLMLAIAVMIKLDGAGSVFFRQRRHGFNGREFLVWKFRTMRHAPDPGSETGIVVQASKDDARVTPLGRILRRTSLDELPQLFNVLRGEMSLVGPRPHALSHNETFSRLIENYYARHRIKPGITGWAQVNGYRGEIRSEEAIEKRIEHDIHYIRNWSFAFDMRILALTMVVAWFHPNAY